MARVEALHTAAGRGAAMEVRDAVPAVADTGLEGDRNFGRGGGRQLTIVSQEELEAAGEELGIVIPPGATRRNVTVSGLKLPRKPGARIKLGSVLVEVVEDCTPCTNMERCVGPGAEQALRGRAGVRARILDSGTITVGDPVTRAM
ncbi:MAG: MOSC domain-containing protein [Planctomycetota bacterium]